MTPAESRRPTPIALITAAVLSLAAAPAWAAGVWTPIGPGGGSVTSLLVDPGDPDTVYAGTGSGIYRTIDGAASWAPLLASPGGFRTVLDLDRGVGGVLYAADSDGGIQRSDDGGASWLDVSIPVSLTGGADQSVTPDPLAAGVVYAFSFQGIFKSVDGGAGWHHLESFPTIDVPGAPDPSVGVNDLTFDAAEASLWAATLQGVYRSADGGGSWQPASGGLAGDAQRVLALAAAPTVPAALFAATVGGIYRTANGGISWTAVGPGPAGFVAALLADPSAADRLWALAAGRLHLSEDGGATWVAAAGLPDTLLAVAPDPGGSGAVYAGSDLGAHRSAGGHDWTLASTGLTAHNVVVLDGRPDTGGRLLAATFDGPLFRSADAGATWTAVLDAEPAGGGGDVATSADPARVYARRSRTVHRSLDGGATWQTASSFPSDELLFGLWVHPDDPEVVFVGRQLLLPFSEDPTYILRSADGGTTWEIVLGGGILLNYQLAFGAAEPAGPRTLLATSGPSVFGESLLRSDDDGVTWDAAERSGLDPFDRISDLVGDPRAPGRFLGWVAGIGLLETVDDGDSWVPFGAGLPAVDFVRLSFDPVHPTTVYAGTRDQGVFRSLDRGATWRRYGASPSDRLRGVFSFAVTGEPAQLFAGTDRGVWVAGPDTSPCMPDDVTLCLNGGRFEARVGWQDFQGGAGPGRAVPLTADTGAFWFFRETNLELAVKALDGRAANGFWWIFYGSLSNVPFTLTVRDTETGDERTYDNPPRTFASRGDTRGFPAPVPAGGAAGAAPAAGAGAVADEAAILPGGEAVALGPAEPAGAPLPSSASEAAPNWELLGPFGGPVTALGAEPGDLSTLYAGSADAGLFRSDDGGESWRLLPSSYGISGGPAQVVRFGAGGATYVRYGTGRLARSGDGGATWVEAGVPAEGPGEHFTGPVAPHPTIPGRIYAGGGFGPYRSTDGGDHWIRLDGFPEPADPGQGPLGITGLAHSPLLADTLWAATTREGVFRSADGGEHWSPASGGLAGSGLEGRGLIALPGAPATLLALTVAGVFKTTNGGASWQPSDDGLPSLPQEIVADPATPGRLWARAGGLYRSTDAGATWSAVGPGLPAPVDAVTVGNRGVVAGGPTGAYLSRDGGAAWEPSNAGIAGRPIVEVDVQPGAAGSILAASPAGEALRSDDGGATWRGTHQAGPGRHLSFARSSGDPQVVYAGGGPQILRSDDGGDSWSPIGPVPPPDRAQDTGRVWTDPAHGETVFASVITLHTLPFGVDTPHLFRSTDGGASWTDVWGGLSRPALALAVHPLDRDLVLAGTNAEIRRSADGGQTWQRDVDGLVESPWIEDLAADPAVPGRFLAWVLGAGLFVTADAGDTWSPLGEGLPPTEFGSLLFDPARPGEVYAAVGDDGGVYGSVDGGETWTVLAGVLTSERLDPFGVDLALAGSGPRFLYAATVNGVMRRPVATAPCAPDAVTLCLHGDRFAVRVEWEDFQGGAGDGHPLPLTADTGAFWFFREANLELFVKVLDARAVNGHWWVFYGSLSNVPFTLTVTDTATGTPRVYQNPPRTFASRGDTAAF